VQTLYSTPCGEEGFAMHYSAAVSVFVASSVFFRTRDGTLVMMAFSKIRYLVSSVPFDVGEVQYRSLVLEAAWFDLVRGGGLW